MRFALAEAASLGVEVHVLSAGSPAGLFILDGAVYYRPTGSRGGDARRVRRGLCMLSDTLDAAPHSGVFLRPESQAAAAP